jgi:cytochrome c peroxidase
VSYLSHAGPFHTDHFRQILFRKVQRFAARQISCPYYTQEKAALGKKLYFDTRISVTAAQSCASCHSAGFGWGDGLPVGVGHGMAKLGRHSPTIVNAAWGAIFMWDGRLGTLEEQALGPIQAAGEMNMPLETLMERHGSIPEYKPLFASAFPQEGMTSKTLAKAIATYERTVVSERRFHCGHPACLPARILWYSRHFYCGRAGGASLGRSTNGNQPRALRACRTERCASYHAAQPD